MFYVIRENRTYDQVLGDLEQGNGDPTLAIFGEEVTPNAHALAREFVLLDNFYVDAEVSYDGHAFSTGAYATDVVEKLWPTNYGRRGGVYLSEGGYGDRNPYGNLSAPSDGYIWDFATRANVSVRSYGEFADWAGTNPDGTRRVEASVPGLQGQGPSRPIRPTTCRSPTTRRIDVVAARSSGSFEANGELPRLNIIRLGNDHTYGTRPDAPTPRVDGGGERRRAGPAGRGDQPQPVLERIGDLRARGRRAERARPRRLAPLAGVRHQPVHEARRGRQHALHHVRHAADDGADPRPAADEPVRRRGDADVRRVPDHAGARRRTRRCPRACRSTRRTRPTPGAPRRRWP